MAINDYLNLEKTSKKVMYNHDLSFDTKIECLESIQNELDERLNFYKENGFAKGFGYLVKASTIADAALGTAEINTPKKAIVLLNEAESSYSKGMIFLKEATKNNPKKSSIVRKKYNGEDFSYKVGIKIEALRECITDIL